MTKKIWFHTLGCRLNQAETSALENCFLKAGFDIVNEETKADIAVVNTCTVTEHSDVDTRRLVNRINRMNPKCRIALIGCQAQIQKKDLAKLPNVFWVVGNAKKMDLVDILSEPREGSVPQVIVPVIPKDSFTMPISPLDRKHTRANLKIQDGCDFFCSFCEIPYARGRARSRKFDDILLEANAMGAGGHKEIVLTGINLGAYRYKNMTLVDIIDALEKIDSINRIRISSIEPTTVPDGLIERMKSSSKLCRYLHLPLQSGCNKILKLMSRKYLKEQMSAFVQDVHHRVPEVCIGTDIIVGFPGETDEDFEETRSFIRDLPFAYVHVFSYSSRRLAKSKMISHPVSPKDIQQRSQILRDLSFRKRRSFYQSLLGKNFFVLFEQKKGDFWFGVTDNYVRVKATCSKNIRNQILPVRMNKMEGAVVLGEMN